MSIAENLKVKKLCEGCQIRQVKTVENSLQSELFEGYETVIQWKSLKWRGFHTLFPIHYIR